MGKIPKPIALNEKSFSVRTLHKALEALGLPASEKEVTDGNAGQDTLKQVRFLQARSNIPVNESTLADEATLLGIAKALEERGLTEASRSFTVTGAVKLPNGAVKKRQQLLAFDLDLRSVAVYRGIKNITEIRENGGFEFLGQAVSDNQGNYSIKFYDWQYGQAERKKADVVVYAANGEKINGLSRMVNSEDYSDKGLVRDLDVLITEEDKRTEYEALMSELNAFLQENKVSLNEIATSGEQLAFTAGELDVDLSRINIAARAVLLAKQGKSQLSHELLYGTGRQNIELTWPALFKKQEDGLREAIAKSVAGRIIRSFNEEEITAFIKVVLEYSVPHVLDDKDEKDSDLNIMLSNTLPGKKKRVAFMKALGTFKGSDFREFWDKHLPAQPEFKDNPRLVSKLQFAQQLTLLTGNHHSLVKELLVNKKITSVRELVEFDKTDWLNILKKTGVPDTVEGKNNKEKLEKRAGEIKSMLYRTFPTQYISRMVEKNELPIEKVSVSKSLGVFLSKNEKFAINSSRIHDFDEEIKAAAGKDFDEVRSELMKIQRIFQVSPVPEAIPVLVKNNLLASHTIASVPRKTFIKTHAEALGGEDVAMTVHQRASHIQRRAEMIALNVMEHSHGLSPRLIMGEAQRRSAVNTLNKHIPNYTELFGSPDICECKECRSVLSPAAYFVDLLRFLHFGRDINGKTLLNRLNDRRPDLVHLPLSCENTNTLIPYIDLVNEVMEYYTANGSLEFFEGYDTGQTTAGELRANPQNFKLEAYNTLKDAKYPFTLPYHQPLDVIRTYSDHLKVNRYEVMKAMNPEPRVATRKAIEAESLGISPEEYAILTGQTFGGVTDSTEVWEYYGYQKRGNLEMMSGVPEFLKRAGLAYTELVELVKTMFINPYQGTLDFLQELFSYSSLDAKNIYKTLEKVAKGSPPDIPEISEILHKYNRAAGSSIEIRQFALWLEHNFEKFQQVITLYEKNSKCDLDNTRLRTIQSIYEGSKYSGIPSDTWSKIHRFIRLWRKLGWPIHETDVVLAALGQNDITAETISKLESFSLLHTATKLPLNQLAVLWGNIDTYGDESLYKKLFLNKAVQRIDKAFKADAWGNYLQDPTKLDAHKSAILAAFRITEKDLAAILEVAKVKDGNKALPLNMNSAVLNIQNLSTIYRYAVLARALKMPVPDMCRLMRLFGASPFSIWDIKKEIFTDIFPDKSHAFYRLAGSTVEAGFKLSTLEYILQGTLPPDSTTGIKKDKALQTARAIRGDFAAIEQTHPATPESPLTVQTLTTQLAVTFQYPIVSRFMEIIQGTAPFEIITDKNLNITIPATLAAKYTYSKSSGRLVCVGIMSDTEKANLKGLTNAGQNFQSAVQRLYSMPENFIEDNFTGLFSKLDEAKSKLLRETGITLDEKLNYVYSHFLPVLKSKLQRDTVNRHFAGLIGLTEEVTGLLIAQNVDALVRGLSTEGFSAAYFSGANWNNLAKEKVDSTINFSWENAAPDLNVPADNFSARWRAYIAAPASGDYTLAVEVEEGDETFKLYLDDRLILENTDTTRKVTTSLDAARMHLLTLEYAEVTGKAGIRLRWNTATTALEIVPSSAAYPAGILDAFADKAVLFHRAAEFISGFEISKTELDHFITFGADFGNIDFRALTASHWDRMRDYTSLRNSVPQARAKLTDVFKLANSVDPPPTVAQLSDMLHLATAWDTASLNYLVAHFQLSIADFKNEIWINQLSKALQIVRKTGVAADTLAIWGAAENDFGKLDTTAQLIKNAVKAKYGEDDWLNIAGGLSDKIRENQKQALISYLLTQKKIQDWGAEDADGLFEYFLIDVQMGSCMDTSRVVQATSAVQMFINRCLLNLEEGISLDAIDKDRWKWMQSYRVWEANRKVMLHPMLEPEYRKDRSEFFKEMESYLVQNDITGRSVEQGLRNYLTSLNEVANPEVCGMHRENDEKGELKLLHVFARTHNAPYKFFYRIWNKYGKWSAWEKMQLDIRCVEDGENSGVHLIPVVWKKRLFLFWPEFMKKSGTQGGEKTKSIEKIAKEDTISSMEPTSYWEIRLAWSEYIDGKWNPKQVSKELLKHWQVEKEMDLLFTALVLPYKQQQRLDVFITTVAAQDEAGVWLKEEGIFLLSDIQSSLICIDASHLPLSHVAGASNYRYSFSTRLSGKKLVNKTQTAIALPLKLQNTTYLGTNTIHKLLPVDSLWRTDITLDSPFFFSDAYRTYFVRPKYSKITISYTDTESTGENLGMIPVSSQPPKKSVELESYDGLEFHTFYHPFSSQYVTRLNEGGIPGLMKSDTEIPPDGGDNFAKYEPQFGPGKVLKPADFPQRTYYQENVCFDPHGANSSYNWELFFHVPLYIATRLSRNGKYEEAMKWFHYIFDPTTDEMPGPGEKEISRYWKVLPFKTTPSEKLEDWFIRLNRESDPSSSSYNPNSELSAIVSEWRDNPFDPHLVASNRPLEYMKHVVIKYVENLVAWGDSLFRQFTRESVNQAIQYYVIAGHILGPHPQLVPSRGEIKVESYATLENKWDAFSNALVELENLFPYSSDVSVSSGNAGPSFLGVGSALYFCVPPDPKLLKLWDTVEDRLFKIRHCQDIDGVERKLALFAPPISPELLVQAASQGLSLSSILADISSPPPIYRFTYLVQKANEFCADVKALGSALLAAREKKDAEELGRLRASHETGMLELITAIREKQVLDAKANKENLLKARETAKFRLEHYTTNLLGTIPAIQVPEPPALAATAAADSPLPTDVSIVPIETDVDVKTVESDESGVKLIPREKKEIDSMETARTWQELAQGSEALAAIMHIFPIICADVKPFGLGAGVNWGGMNLANSVSASGKVFDFIAGFSLHEATMSAKMASYIRREQEWTLQANLARREIIQLDKQMTSADIRIQIAEKELENHKQQIMNSREIELFLKDKFTNQELYQWMSEQTFTVYRQSYNLASDMVMMAKKALENELGRNVISNQYEWWDNSMQGLLAGEKLQLALRQMEKLYLQENRRELELTRHISLSTLDPLALIELRETGKCNVSLPEELFDLDVQCHYFRRIKSASISIPCIAGPYTTVNCSLRLLKNTTRISTSMNSEGKYEHENDEGVWTDDPRFRTNYVPVTSIATSTGINDAGMFELSFRDERYLPFEGAGAISEWEIELTTTKELRQFDYSTISDVILHLKYTARECLGIRDKVVTHVTDFINNSVNLAEQPLARMFSMRHEYPTEWHKFLHPADKNGDQVLSFTVGKERFPFFVQYWKIVVMQIDVFAECSNTKTDYDTKISYKEAGGNTVVTVTSEDISMSRMETYGDLSKATVDGQVKDEKSGVSHSLEEMDIEKAMSLYLKQSGLDYKSLKPDEVKDIFLVFHYKVEPRTP